MPTDSLHPDQAQPYYTTIPVEEYDRINSRIADLEEERRWRKCSEELPTENDYYLVTNGGFVDFEYWCYNEQDEEWQWDHNGKWQYWMPMPNPPKEDT